MLANSDGRSLQPNALRGVARAPGLDGAGFMRRFRWLIFYTWSVPPVFGLSFILLVGVLTPREILDILLTPLEPLYILGWLAFALWYLPRSMRPLAAWLDRTPGADAMSALRAMQTFALRFWAVFLIYLVLAPVFVMVAASLYTAYAAEPIDLFRIELIALIVSIVVGLPIFFLILNLFGRAAADLAFDRPFVTLRTKVFLIGALVPLLIDTMLVQYYWARTAYFSLETVVVWLGLELLAIGGSLIFARSFALALGPLGSLISAAEPMSEANLAALVPSSTDELGIVTRRYRTLLEDLRAYTETLELTNRILQSSRSFTTVAEVVNELIRIGDAADFGEQIFLFLADPAAQELVCVAHSRAPYDPGGHFRLGFQDQSVAVFAFNRRETVVVENAVSDPRVSPAMREKFGVRSSLAVPLQAQEEVIGVFMAISCQEARAYTPAQTQMLEHLAHEAAVTLQAQRLREARAQADADRRKRDRLVRLLLTSTAEAIYGADMNGKCTFANPACVRMLGYQSENDLVGKVIHDLIHHTRPDGSPYSKQDCRVWLATVAGKPSHVDDEVHWRADGSSFPVEYWSHPMIEDGRLVGAVVTFIDISERKRAERALVNHNRLLRTIAALNAALVHGGNEAELMTGVCRILAEEGRFRMAWIGLVEADGVHVRPAAQAGNGTAYLAQVDIRCDDTPQGQGPSGTAIRQGSTLVNDDVESNPRFLPWREQARAQGYRSSAATPLRKNGRIIGALMVYSAEPNAFGADEVILLERLAADLGSTLERRAAEVALQESEAKARLLLNSAAEGIYGIDMQGLCTFANPAALSMLGYEKEDDLVGRNMHELIHHAYPDGTPYPKDRCHVRLSTLQGRPTHVDDEVHWRADGSSFEVEYWSHPLYRNKELVGAVVTFVDISKRRQTERELQHYRENLERRVAERTAELTAINRELEAFSYSVSHDLRAPLRGIDGFSQALLEDYSASLDGRGKDYLERVRRGAQRMGALIDDLLALSRMTRMPMKFAPLDLVGPAREVVAELREQYPERKVDVVLPARLEAVGDRGLLKIVLQNLIGNAWKYTAPRAEAHIELGGRAGEGETIYFVRDNGVGFDMAYSHKLFTPFQRLHSDAEFEGSGIGLATVQRIILRHGGRVWAEAAVPQGAVFYFSLPHRQAS